MRTPEQITADAELYLSKGLTPEDIYQTVLVAEREDDWEYWRKVHTRMIELAARNVGGAVGK